VDESDDNSLRLYNKARMRGEVRERRGNPGQKIAKTAGRSRKITSEKKRSRQENSEVMNGVQSRPGPFGYQNYPEGKKGACHLPP